MDNADIQKCHVLISDAFIAWRKMRGINSIIDDEPTLENCRDMVESDIRNKLAHEELEFYSKHKTFLFKHPFLKQSLQEEEMLRELSELKKTNPAGFINELTNMTQNIRRYESLLNKENYKNEKEKNSWEKNLNRAKLRQSIAERIISNN